LLSKDAWIRQGMAPGMRDRSPRGFEWSRRRKSAGL